MQRGGYEAVSLGKPLITSHWPLLREVFSRGTVHVDNSTESIIAAVRQIQEQPETFRREIAVLRRTRAVVAASQVSKLKHLCQTPLDRRNG